MNEILNSHPVVLSAEKYSTDVEGYAATPSVVDADRDLVEIVGVNLKRLRHQRGLSLDALAKLSTVSRAMLSQVENGRSSPTVTVLFKIATALNVTLAEFISQNKAQSVILLQAKDTKQYVSQDGAFISRALFPINGKRLIEFHEISLKSFAAEVVAPLPQGAIKQIVVNTGSLEILLDEKKYLLEAGDTIIFHADQPHELQNPSNQITLLYQIINLNETLP